MAIRPAQISSEELVKMVLAKGVPNERSRALAIMEATKWIVDKPHRDSFYVDKVITEFLWNLSGRVPDDEKYELKSVIPEIIGTYSDNMVLIRKRVFILTDFVIRSVAPRALEAVGLTNKAQRLRSLLAVDEHTAKRTEREARWALNVAYKALWKVNSKVKSRAAQLHATYALEGAHNAAKSALELSSARDLENWPKYQMDWVLYHTRVAAEGASTATIHALKAKDPENTPMWGEIMPEIIGVVRRMADTTPE